MEITGFNGLQKELDRIAKKADKVSRDSQVSFDELFTSSFMRKYTSFSSFDELLRAGNFNVQSQQDFENIPDALFDRHIAATTKFRRWEDMIKEAASQHILKKLDF